MRRIWPVLTLASTLGCRGVIDDPKTTELERPGGPGGSTSQPICVAGEPRDPGRVTIHRINRAEYDNTVRDLLGTTTQPAADFPYDDHGYGFDNIADVLSTAPLLVEKYEAAAELLVDELLATPFEGPVRSQFEAEDLGGSTGALFGGGTAWNLYSNGTVSQTFEVEIPGAYNVSTRVFGQQGGPDPVRIEVTIDGRSLGGALDVPETSASPRTIEVRVDDLTAGTHTLSVAFLNDYYDADNGVDRNLIVDWLAVEGPLDYNPPANNPEAYARVMVCDPTAMDRDECAAEIVSRFAKRAWRRPVTEDEVNRLVALANIAFAEGDGFDVGIGLSLQAILLSPHFLFRVELDPVPTSTEPHALSPHELATRLSYFLWSSMPDDRLMSLADDGTLRDEAVLRQEVRRMLEDSKADALVDNFAGQWLYTRALDDAFPDPNVYETWNDELKASMRAETRMFVKTFLSEDKNFIDMLDADFMYLNDPLARHYGLPEPGSPTELVRVDMTGARRGGFLTQGTFLTVTSRPRRTAPVIRGKWILEQLLCDGPPPPPANVPGFPEGMEVTGSVRERTEAHRADPSCRGCHEVMDPLGFALEHYDGVGAWRDRDGEYAIDSTGTLPDGRAFADAQELAQILKSDPNTPHCMTEQAFVYALGRGHEVHDVCSISDITEAFNEGGNTFSALVEAMVTHPSFTMRRGEPE